MIKNILDVVGNTPIVKLNNITDKDNANILLKYERTNPGGSIKDRPAKFIIEEAERRGLLKPNGTIIESSSGNFGISLAMIGAAKKYKVIILVDPKVTETNYALLKAYGAEVIVVTEKDDCGNYHKTRISLANKMANEIENSFRPDQCFSYLNSQAHYLSTVREIISDCNENLAAIVIPVSTGGQIGGISRYIKEFYPHIKIIGVDAEGSVAFGGIPHLYKIPGIGLGWTPNNIDINLIDEIYKLKDEAAFVTARIVARQEGILIGPTSGASLLVGLHLASQFPNTKNILCMGADGGDRYVKTLFNDEWMKENEFSLDTNTSTLNLFLKELNPLNKELCENYQEELIQTLNVPKSTIDINKEIKIKN